MRARAALVVLALAGLLASCHAKVQRKARASNAFNLDTEAALLDIKSSWTSVTAARKLDASFKTWVAGAACTTWAYTTCDASGNLLTLVMQGLALYGNFLPSFYKITTLTMLDLRKNRLYGKVGPIAMKNLNLVYLDLSDNYFTGRFPDVWANPAVTEDGGPFYTFRGAGGVALYVNISYTYFTGNQTIKTLSTDPSVDIYAYGCIGNNAQVAGDTQSSCIDNLFLPYSGTDPGQCKEYPTNAYNPQSTTCTSWCNQGTPLGLCYNRLGAHCKPIFQSATSDVIVSKTCVIPKASPVGSPPAFPGVLVNAQDYATLKGIATTLGQPKTLALLSAPAPPVCTTLTPLVTCDVSGAVIGINFNDLKLARATIPTAIANLASLQALYLRGNTFYGTWPFSLSTQLLNLVILDLSVNFLTGPVPTNFNQAPLFVNVSNNYFTGDHTIQSVDGSVYCSFPGVQVTFRNCLTPYLNSPCPGEGQRSTTACGLFCGINPFPDALGNPPVAACANYAGTPTAPVLCVPSVPASGFPTGKCTGTLTTPPPPVPCQGRPATWTQWLNFAKVYKGYGTPASVFSTWTSSNKCSAWKGFVCDSKCNVIAINFRGFGIVGPFPGPKAVQDLIWSTTFNLNTIIYVDLSNNVLYGDLDPNLASLPSNSVIRYLDIGNNYITGSLPKIMAVSLVFFNAANNYLSGVPTVVGLDGASPYCPGYAIGGTLDNNCYLKSPVPGTECAKTPTKRTTAACKAFCGLGVSKGCPPKTPVCKPLLPTSKGKFACVASGK